MRWALVAPPGSSWESDFVAVLRDLFEHRVVCAREPTDLRDVDCVALCGDETWARTFVSQAVAAGTLGRAVAEHASEGGLLLAIGAGFGAACSLGLLPGRLVPNEPEGFLGRMLPLRVEGVANAWAERAMVGDVWRLPVRSAAARFVAAKSELDQLDRDGLVLLRFTEDAVGSDRDIAAIMSPRRNVLGIAVHPENVVDASLVEPQWPGLDSGRILFESIADWVDVGAHRGSIESER
ncbi:MAG: phosphoribosylformylglycinamidine synthase subunit PurQ [Candidatus Binatia bacterium]|nr:phosphoribosylformylglycinamidine synthase subunit PurQ [Candidatus Binatia bacterium]